MFLETGLSRVARLVLENWDVFAESFSAELLSELK
jgi:hypothetical protein